ncbi:MAG: branched-chain amino acid transaminase [Tannerellaceae bacterium]
MIDSRLIWLSGEIMPVDKAVVNVLSPTSQFGLNVFEGIRAYWSESSNQLYIFKLQEHCERLMRSVKMVRFECDYSIDYLKSSVIEIIKANSYKEDIAIRQTIFIDGFGNWSSTGKVGMFIAPIPKGRQLTDKEGISCCISSWDRISENSLSPKIKMGANYMNSRLAQMEANRNGYDCGIFLNSGGKVSEGPGACLFIVRDGKLITPNLSSSILESITRNTVIHLASEILKMDVEEREIDRTELYIADEVFMCGSAVEILPVLSVDGLNVGDGRKGKWTTRIEDTYFSVLRNEMIINDSWLTPVY